VGVNVHHVRAEVGFPMQVRVERETTVTGTYNKDAERDGDMRAEDVQEEDKKRFMLPPLRDIV
jgi:hypothetical protein